MKIKRTILLLTLFSMSIILIGCSSFKQGVEDGYQAGKQANTNQITYSAELQERAKYEQQALEKTNEIAEQTRDIYEQYNDGQLSFAEFQKQLIAPRDETKSLRDADDSWYATHKLADEDMNTELYKNGLYYGKSLRLNLYSFLIEITNMTTEDKQKISYEYDGELISGWDRKLNKLEPAIKEVLK